MGLLLSLTIRGVALMLTWKLLKNFSSDTLQETRLQLHWAVQLVAAANSATLPPKDDYSHTSLNLIDEDILAGGFVGGNQPFATAIQISNLTLLNLDETGRPVNAYELIGQKFSDALIWLTSSLGGLGSQDVILVKPTYDMPEHLVANDKKPFEPNLNALALLSSWYSNAHKVLSKIQESESSSPVFCWPHHFDIATLIDLGQGKSVGVGLSPGDGSYNEPYWYVSPWPYPKEGNLPKLPIGHWHTEGFTAGVLSSSEVVQANDATEQEKRVMGFLEATVNSCKTLLGT